MRKSLTFMIMGLGRIIYAHPIEASRYLFMNVFRLRMEGYFSSSITNEGLGFPNLPICFRVFAAVGKI